MPLAPRNGRFAILLFAVALETFVLACERGPVQQEPAPPAKESVRAQLAQAQRKNGLSLVLVAEPRDDPESKSDPVLIVAPADRSMHRWNRAFQLPDSADVSGGALTADGNVAALELDLPKGQLFGIFQRRKSKFRQLKATIPSWPYFVCWSNDNSKLTVLGDGNLQVLDPVSGLILESGPSATDLTSQCMSPDDRRLVYELNDEILVYDFEQHKSRRLAHGTGATWSPAGEWIAFRSNDTYYGVRPSGEGQKVLFKCEKDLPNLLSPLWWSPDSRVVAYVGPLRQGEGLPLYALRLRVRRLEDDSEDWVAEIIGATPPGFQWITNNDLRQDAGPAQAHDSNQHAAAARLWNVERDGVSYAAAGPVYFNIQ